MSNDNSSKRNKMSELPYAIEAEIALTHAEIDALREQFNKEGTNVSPQTKFNYAWGLIRSRNKHEQQLGVQLLFQIYKENQSRRRECLYYLALGHYRLGHYQEAKKFNDSLLSTEPNNPQSQSLKRLIDEKAKTESIIGLAIVGSVVAAAGFIVGSILKRR